MIYVLAPDFVEGEAIVTSYEINDKFKILIDDDPFRYIRLSSRDRIYKSVRTAPALEQSLNRALAKASSQPVVITTDIF